MKGSTIALFAGVLALMGGIIALLFPLPAGLAVTTFTGVAFLIAGALGLFGAFSHKDMPRRGWVAFIALLQLVLGVAILADPLAGLVSLTIIAGSFFLASGVVRLVLAWRLRQQASPVLLALTGVLSLALGLYVFFSPTAASTVLLGTLLAVELLSAGAALIALGLALRKL